MGPSDRPQGPSYTSGVPSGSPGPGRRRSQLQRQAARRKVRRRRILAGVLVVALVVVGAGIGFYLHLDKNLHTVKLTSGGGKEKKDNQGRTPINLLIIGSDTRSSSEDCKIGGDCSTSTETASSSAPATSSAANADVEMLVHISADRSNATVMSIPRDTYIKVPACTDPSTGATETPHMDRINSTLQYGPNCTVAAVHQLTGVPIDHFMVIDFAGVVKMSDAVGGVNVCVDNNVYDPYSHLKLTKGDHTLKGLAALEFLRTRHGFGDGSDIGRTVAQHIFLSSMLRNMESASTLTNPVKVVELADAATSAITVDTGLGSVADLTSLAYQMNQVPGDRTTFVTMPNVPYAPNPNVVVPAGNAQALFTKIADDVSLSQPKATASASASASPSASASASTSPSTPATTTPSSAAQPSATDYAMTVDGAQGCAQVSHAYTVEVNGVIMNPIEAFSASPNVPLSAP
ncbi:LytR family transcriptional attenuator [Rudaeicoccus suwonensis]|uniref:LytR family transcriptional attenuator n=1 Tax=Rudaeicoccus suwonensis TaxID=657409 RepID=A0A561E9V5_9MICO|nr:LytR family transcriptional attenuator [Rudaeicoccus suwonensis]